MFIARYENVYGNDYWVIEDSIEYCIIQLEYKADEAVDTDKVSWFKAEPIKVNKTVTYAIE